VKLASGRKLAVFLDLWTSGLRQNDYSWTRGILDLLVIKIVDSIFEWTNTLSRTCFTNLHLENTLMSGFTISFFAMALHAIRLDQIEKANLIMKGYRI